MTEPGFRPTHVVPGDGLPTWETPDPSRPTVPLDALLPVQLLDRHGDWGRVLCANGWSAWVDGRLLVPVPQDPPVAGGQAGRTDDPRPLLALAEETVNRYRAAVEDLVDGRLDGEAFRARTGGLRLGLVVDGEALWLYETSRERWLYCDGTRLGTYAAARDPSPGDHGQTPREPAPAAPEPTRVVHPEEAGERPPAPADAEPTRVADPAAAPPEPTRVADPAPDPPGPTRAARPGPSDPAEPARGARKPPDHDETRLVPPVTPDE
jgi:hypothetical protein